MNFETFGFAALGGFVQALLGFIKSAHVNGQEFNFWSFFKSILLGALTGGTVTFDLQFAPGMAAALAGLIGLGGGNMISKMIDILIALEKGAGGGK